MNYNAFSYDLRKDVADMIYSGKGGHIGGDMSVMEILVTLYFRVMNISPDNFGSTDYDRFILSKEHCIEALYAVLAAKGFFPIDEVKKNYLRFGTEFIGHPNVKIPGIEINGVSLGHGLSVAVGMALAAKMNGSGSRVYVVMGDGELAEGQVWEAAMAASHYHLDNLCAVIDRNRLKFGTVDSWLIYRLCGEHLCDVSNASRTQLMNLSSLRWDENILKIFGITPEMLPKILPSDGNFGMTDFCGLLKHKAPILAVMGDSHSALFTHRCENPGQLKITYGTGSSVMMNTGSRIIRSENGLASSVAWGFGGKIFYALEGNINYSGAVVTWLKDSLKLINSPAETEALAENANISDRTCLVPAFSGLGATYWSENSHAAIVGMSRLTGKAEIVRAALSSICLQINDVLEAMKRDSGLDMGIAYADGGPSENRYLMQLQSNLSRIAIKVSEENELSALGVGFMAGIRAGLFSDDAAFGKIKYRSFTPKMSDGERKTRLSDWKRAVEAVAKGSI